MEQRQSGLEGGKKKKLEALKPSVKGNNTDEKESDEKRIGEFNISEK